MATFRMLWREHGAAECGVQMIRLDPHLDTAPHDHLFLEIALIERGEAQHQTAAGEAIITAGQLLIIRPGVWHGYIRCRDMIVTNCLISTRSLHQLLPILEPVPAADAMFRRRCRRPADDAPQLLIPSRGVFSRIRESFAAMLQEQRRHQPGFQPAMIAHLLHVMTLLLRTQTAPASNPLPPATAAAVRKAAAIIEQTHTHEPSLNKLAAEVALSPGHLSRSFKRHMGMGLIDYAHHLRIEEACRLLRLSELPITQIATRVGYAEIAYFSRCFRRRMGASPQEYRRTQAPASIV